MTSSTTTTERRLPPLQAVSGSSSGAIAATMLVCLPHKLEEYAELFCENRGHAFRTLKSILSKEEPTELFQGNCQPELYICTTRCYDMSMHLFSFVQNDKDTILPTCYQQQQRDRLLQAVQASCTIPKSYHPLDRFFPTSLMGMSYDGIDIHGVSYADGGIVAPVPPSPYDHDPMSHRIVVCPWSGPNKEHDEPSSSSSSSSSSSLDRISPRDTSWSLPFSISLQEPRYGTCSIRLSIQNGRALLDASGGAIRSSMKLQWWYQQGKDDAHSFLEHWQNKTKQKAMSFQP